MLSLKTLQYSQENICVGGSSGATLLKKTLTQVFSYEHCEIFKNTYFEEHLRTAASRYISKKKKLRLKTKKHEYVMSQTERTGTKNKKLGLKKRNNLGLPYSVQIREKTNQKNSEYGPFSLSAKN